MTDKGRNECLTTSVSRTDRDRIVIRGYDLVDELLGKVTFTDMVAIMLLGDRPTGDERRMLDALLVSLVEHGINASILAARLVYSNSPDSIQAGVATALLAAGNRRLGSSEQAAEMLQGAFQSSKPIDAEAEAVNIVERFRATGERLPGLGHPTHTRGDPRVERLLEVAKETRVYGPNCELMEAIAAEAKRVISPRLILNVTGAIAAISSDLGLDWRMGKSFALIGRSLGALAHLQEEMSNAIGEKIKDVGVSSVQFSESDGNSPTASQR